MYTSRCNVIEIGICDSVPLMQGDRTDKRGFSAYNTWKDIVIPGNVHNDIPLVASTASAVIQPLPLSKRKYLANYLGRAQGKVGRLQLIKLAKQFPKEVCSSPLLLHILASAFSTHVCNMRIDFIATSS